MKFLEVKAVDGVIKMSKIVKGADYFGVTIPEETALALMDRYVELGGNTIDTARLYGKINSDDDYSHSEPIVGRWLKSRRNRKDIVLITKGGHPKRSDLLTSRITKQIIDEELEISLRELGVDYVDIYFPHRDNPDLPVGEIMDMLDLHVKAGRVRALGASNWTCARIKEANTYALAHGKTPFTVSQIQWGLAHTTPAHWDDPTLIAMNDIEYAGYLESGIPVMGFAPQGGGYFSKCIAGEPLKPKVAQRYDNEVNRHRLEVVRAVCERTGKSPAVIGMAYLTSNPVQTAAIIGCSTVAQLEDCMSDLDLTLDARTCAELVR